MSDIDLSAMDFVRELRLRQWARQHFVAVEARRSTWHPVVLDEMSRRDRELANDGRAADLSIPHRQIAAEIPLEQIDELPETESVVQDAFSGEYQLGPGSAFVPLAPTGQWRFDPAMSEVPKPHGRMAFTHTSHSTEASRAFRFA